MKIEINNKYLDVYNKNDKHIQYFEHFETKESKSKVVRIIIEDEKGERFLRRKHGKILECEILWFGEKIKKKRVMFIFSNNNNEVSYLVII